ncbi:MAG: glycoside hydrolase family 26 protein [Peptoniphilaceae bacterium]
MKKFIFSLIILITVLASSKIYAISDYELKEVDSGIKIENYLDGYSIIVPKDSKVKFDSNFYTAIVDYKNTNLKILIQDLTKEVNYQTYVEYSFRGVRKSKGDFKITYDGIIKSKKGNVSAIEYHRNNLSQIENDKNYYLTLYKKVSENKALTILSKSSSPINRKEIIDIADSFTSMDIRVKRKIKKEPMDLSYGQSGELLLGRDWDVKTANLYYEDFLKKDPLKWGIFTNVFWNSNELTNIENKINKQFKYMLMYHTFNNPNENVRKAIKFCKDRDRVVELTFQTEMSSGKNQIFEVLDGKRENYFREMARIIAEEKHPTLFRLDNEMNGDWCSYSAWNTGLDTSIYKEFYNYVYRIFEEEGANKYLIYVFNPNGRSFPNFKFNDESMYRPESDKYDVIGLTLYNTGNYYPGEYWESFDELYYDLYKDVESKYDKPMMITEFSSNVVGGNKVEWVEDMFESIKDYPKIKVAVWFNGIDLNAEGKPARNYKIDEPKELLDVFKNNINSK